MYRVALFSVIFLLSDSMNLFIEINRNKLKYASGKHIIVINEIPIRLGFHFSNGAEKGCGN